MSENERTKANSRFMSAADLSLFIFGVGTCNPYWTGSFHMVPMQLYRYVRVFSLNCLEQALNVKVLSQNRI